MQKPLLLILSHKKSTNREIQIKSLINDDRFYFYYMIGDPMLKKEFKLDEENHILYLKVTDNYESLSLKVMAGFKFAFEEMYNKIYGIFKTDDDIDLDVNKLFPFIEKNKSVSYFGKLAESTGFNSDWHLGKCESEELNMKRILVPPCKYCFGGGYYISRYSLLKISLFENRIIFEDINTGILLNECGIFPQDMDIKSNGCSWVEPAPKMDNIFNFNAPPVNIDRCICGEIKNKRDFNFCRKCNRLY